MSASVIASDTRADLERLSRARAFFAHRSVGADLVDGIARLARDEAVSLRIVETDAEVPNDSFAHASLGANGDPATKLRDLERLLAAGVGRTARVVLFKLCYADFNVWTDATRVFHAYERTIGTLRSAYPGIGFVHVTAPLVAVPGGPKAALRSLLGRASVALAENARREEFNELMRRAFADREPLFDLALAESTLPSGAREMHDLRGRPVPALGGEYTADGGHLLPEARTRIARQFVARIAEAA